jgi:hypothetical protein
MKREVCDRAWQVEAVRDGRLSGTDGVALASHLLGCSSCQSEQRELRALAADLRARGASVDEVALRRLRHTTLEKANALMTATAARTWTRRTTGWSAAACLVVTLAANTLWFARTDGRSVPHSAVSIVADHEAKWQRSLDPDVERVDLAAGTLLFRVARKASDPRLVVRVPDGVIEDLGTVFSVSVREGATTEIVVREGSVMFFRRGDSALLLRAGTIWTPPRSPAPAQASATPSPPKPATVEAPAAPPKNLQSSRHQRRRVRPPRVAGLAAHPAHELLDSGEDAAYLNLLLLLRQGRSHEARLAAAAYLEAFPSGFRRIEVARVAGAP